VAAIYDVPVRLLPELHQQRRTIGLMGVAAAPLAITLVVAAALVVAVQQRNRAERILALATDTASQMTSNLAREYADRPGVRLKLVGDILGTAQRLLDQLTASGETSLEIVDKRQDALLSLASTYLRHYGANAP
jgi:hypothetical protein